MRSQCVALLVLFGVCLGSDPPRTPPAPALSRIDKAVGRHWYHCFLRKVRTMSGSFPSGSAKSSSSVGDPAHPMPCCVGGIVSDTLYATVSSPAFGTVEVPLTYGVYPHDWVNNYGVPSTPGWYGTIQTCDDMTLAVVVRDCLIAIVLTRDVTKVKSHNEWCLTASNTLHGTCEPMILEATLSELEGMVLQSDKCLCGITSLSDLTPFTAIVTE